LFFLFSNPKIDNPDPSNARSAYLGEVLKLKSQNPTPIGVVVSADPYFRTTAQDFTFAMTALMPGIPVCYPFGDFSLSSSDIYLPHAPVLSSSVNAADANTGYFQLGERAADVLNNSTDTQPVPPTKASSKYWFWDGTQATWMDA
jgi:hypothetical protein